MADWGGIAAAFVGGAGAGVADVGLREIQGRIDADKAATLEAARHANASALSQQESGQRQAEYAARTPVDVARAEALLPSEKAKAEQEGEVKVDVAKRSPRTLSPGASEIVDNKVAVTAPEKALPAEQLAYYQANANRLNAEANAINEGMKYRAKPGAAEKPMMPNIKVEKDADGNPYMIDQNSGAIGIIRPGEPAKPGASHWFSPDEPATKAGAPTTDWNLNGKPVQLEQLYPSISGRVGGAAGPSAMSGWDNATGDVIVNGKKIGAVDPKSKTAAADAEKMAANYKPSAKTVANPVAGETPVIASKQAAKPAQSSSESQRQAAYQKALQELNDMKGSFLPTPAGKKKEIAAKEAEVNRLYAEIYK